MIKNERQYKISKSQIARFEAELERLTSGGDKNRSLRKLEVEAITSQLDELREEVRHFEQLRVGPKKSIHVGSFDDLPQALVEARIAAGLTQKELAERMGLKEQQIQRYEATAYASASLSRLKQVMESLGAELAGDVTCSG